MNQFLNMVESYGEKCHECDKEPAGVVLVNGWVTAFCFKHAPDACGKVLAWSTQEDPVGHATTAFWRERAGVLAMECGELEAELYMARSELRAEKGRNRAQAPAAQPPDARTRH